MCGIAGILNPPGAPVNPVLLRRMIDRIRYRGPDFRGAWTEGRAGFAHARLSIIDIGGGRQPMHNDDRSLTLTFNGEIFNYVELRNELRAKGVRFTTDSDTEVILRLYEERGAACVDALNGDFAFAIWDARNQTLFAARDRMGVRPFYYTQAAGAFLFASEVKALFAHPRVKRSLDLEGIDQIFTFWSSLPPRTVFQGINELPPAHTLTVMDGKVELRRYWQLDYDAEPSSLSEDERAEELLALLVDATRIRLRADVPVGAYLSGGLDSSLVSAIARKYTAANLNTFSVTFEDPEFDESGFQREMAQLLGTAHREVRCGRDEIARAFPEVVLHAERPVLRTAPAPLYLLSRLVRDSGYKVVLTGEGADEVFGGYDIFKEAKLRRFCAKYPDSKMRPLLLKRLYPYLPALQLQSPAFLKAFFRSRNTGLFDSHMPRWELTSGLKRFYADDVRSVLEKTNPFAVLRAQLPSAYAGWDPFSQSQYLEASMLLPGYILSAQGDRVAMAHAVEGRFPFLDHRVVELAGRLPARLKMKALKEKYLLKRAARDLLPDSVRNRTKQPYRAPDAASFFPAKSPALDYVDEMLSPQAIERAGLFHAPAVELLAQKARAGRAAGTKDNMALVGILSCQLLHQQFIEPAPLENNPGRGILLTEEPA